MSFTLDITEALKDHQITLNSSSPSVEPADLSPVVDKLDGASVIGLGEGTHGTREFFQLKDRLIRSLVAKKDCRLIALESNFAETMAINEYITNGDGDPVAALDRIYFWTWDTEEVLELIEWLRDFNKGRPSDDQVRFYGIDMQFAAGPARAVDEYLASVDPEFHDQHSEILDILIEHDLTANEEKQNERVAAADEFVSTVTTRFQERETTYIESTSQREYELTVQHLRTLEQALEVKRFQRADDREGGVEFRDQAMAENTSWILNHESHDTLILWGHNGHIRRGVINRKDIENVRSLGDYLDEEYGDRYIAIGFDFGQGRFQAMVNHENEYELSACQLSEPRDGSITQLLASVNEPLYYLSMRDCLEDPTLNGIFTEPREMRIVGAVYHGQDKDEHYETVVVGDVYDGIIFIAETERAIPIERR